MTSSESLNSNINIHLSSNPAIASLTFLYLTAMPIKLEGSCHCGTVHFSVLSSTPIPYQVCSSTTASSVNT